MAIGISVPLYWGRLMAQVIGNKQAEHLCKNAALLSPSEALTVCVLPHLRAALPSAWLNYPEYHT